MIARNVLTQSSSRAILFCCCALAEFENTLWEVFIGCWMGKLKCKSIVIVASCELTILSEGVKEDPVKMHKEANTLYEAGKYKKSEEIFLRAAELYYKAQNFFDSASMYYKAGECVFMLKDYEKAIKHFSQSADLSFKKGFDRFGVSALEYARDSHGALGEKSKVKELDKKVRKIKKKLEATF